MQKLLEEQYELLWDLYHETEDENILKRIEIFEHIMERYKNDTNINQN